MSRKKIDKERRRKNRDKIWIHQLLVKEMAVRQRGNSEILMIIVYVVV